MSERSNLLTPQSTGSVGDITPTLGNHGSFNDFGDYDDSNAGVYSTTTTDNETVFEQDVDFDSYDDSEMSTSKLRKCWNFITGKNRKAKPAKKLGMVMGVIIPNILNIFGVILFLRLGMVVGQSGVWIASAMFSVAYLVVLLTTLSISAVSTNGKVKGGGAYYLISRSLGPEFGGSIGFIFYLGNVAAGAVYVIGFANALQSQFPQIPQGYWGVTYATAAMILLTGISLVGASLFAKTSLLIFIVLMSSIIMAIVSFMFAPANQALGFTSFSWETFYENFAPSFVPNFDAKNGMSITTVFGILFPACTGIMAGVNMSGDLANPAKSIPKGTLIAVSGTYCVYIFLIFLLGSTTIKETLINNYSIMSEVSFVPMVVSIGIWMATLSSALSSIIGGARILQALSRDKLVPLLHWFQFGRGFGKNDEPRIAVIVTFILIQCCVFIYNLNSIAPLQTMFFILSYGVTNFACFMMSITGAPNWRPVFKQFNWFTALMGTILCIIVMFSTNYAYAMGAFAIQGFLMIIIHIYSPTQSWGDITQALIFHQVRKYLLLLDEKKAHVKYWRLSALLLNANPRGSYPLMHFVNQLKKGGIYVVGHVVEGDFNEELEKLKSLQKNYYELRSETKWKFFSEIVVANDLRQGCQNLYMVSGMGGMKPNTVFIGFSDSSIPVQVSETNRAKKSIELFEPLRETSERSMNDVEYVNIIRDAMATNKNIVISRHFEKMDYKLLQPSNFIYKILKKLDNRSFQPSRIVSTVQFKKRNIDLWPLCPIFIEGEKVHPSAALTLQLGFIISLVDVWSKFHRLRLCSIVDTPHAIKAEENRLRELLEDVRIKADINVVSIAEETTDIIASKLVDTPAGDDLTQRRAGIFHSLDMHDRNEVLNNIIAQNSQNTSVSFITMPEIPTEERDHQKWVDEIEVLSRNLPPTMLVKGVQDEM
eukprot:CAMPEP_0117431774 /NCGR_PEP_ID=MMETSP0758-20121206/11317_1 /TAXON_ID=63605 /ORGANISM="Percolomonas cosmopolitus, Strain AE-1 (ATCC 50343)" /LENGTH=934 /DNA_ID=CAMNT_0005221137 /DNA_START=25 /DNA_END=2826 /DNA_ORIENTATION=-